MAKTIHFAKFLYWGILTSESSEREVETRDPKKVDMPEHAFGFYFLDRKLVMDGKEKLWGKDTNTSGIYYYGKEMTLAEVEKEMPGESVLISNMRGNGYKRVVFTGRGTYPLNDDDVILGPSRFKQK